MIDKTYNISDLNNIFVKYIEDNKKLYKMDYNDSIQTLEDLLKEIKQEYYNITHKEEIEFIDKQYNKMEQYVFNASEEELEEHYNWYKVDKGDKRDLLNIMFESYANTYTNEELEKRINDLLD